MNTYKGNSVQHWYAKAKAYKDIVFEVCEAFRSLGYTGEFGDTPTLPKRLAEFADKLNGVVRMLRSTVAELEGRQLYHDKVRAKLRARIERLEGFLKDRIRRCERCSGRGTVPIPILPGTEPCPACKEARAALAPEEKKD